MAVSKQLDCETLRNLIDYDSSTGVFTWRPRERAKPRGGMMRSGPAGCLNADGYLEIRVQGGLYRGHRLAWLYMTGEWPAALVDHKNGDRSDNRWDNLREASRSQNNSNKKLNSNNAAAFKGVRQRASGRFQARIVGPNGGPVHLGMFDTAEQAHEAYIAAAKTMFGEFARAS